ncbi:MAG TPA: hypothetical protein ENJ26_00170 [Rhodobacteraceae bacterium]|nr:hypothetical protein [Paracoccaceae bacterium]
MDFGNLIWLFFIFSMLQPMFQRRMLEAMRLRQIKQLEKKRGSRVILLVHRQETMSFLGFPLMRFIDINDSEAVLRAVHTTDNNRPIDMILHTPGGMVIAATQIARAVKAHPGKVTVFVPHFAMSGGTLISLAADEIVMSPHATLGPVDPQLGNQPAASLVKVLKDKPIKDIDDQTLINADMGSKAISQVHKTAKMLLEGTLPDKKADEVARILSEGRWTHDYPIFVDEAQELGLPVTTDMPTEVLVMMALYPQATQQTPSVEYNPDSGNKPLPKA